MDRMDQVDQVDRIRPDPVAARPTWAYLQSNQFVGGGKRMVWHFVNPVVGQAPVSSPDTLTVGARVGDFDNNSGPHGDSD